MKIKIIGALALLTGVALYFLVENEPYTTIAGFIAGLGFAIILFGAGFSAQFRK